MSKIVFDPSYAEPEEITDIRALLRESGIDFYETPRGNFGRSMAAFWVSGDDQYEDARKLIDAYQAERRKKAIANRPKNIILFKMDSAKWALFLLVAIVLFVAWSTGASWIHR